MSVTVPGTRQRTTKDALPRGARGRPLSDARGMTLFEVIVATAIVLVTCVAVTTVTTTAARAGRQSDVVRRADEALLAEAARLRALPFFSRLPADWPVSHALPAPSAVGELFPHADGSLNEGTPGYIGAGAYSGAYRSMAVVTGAEVRRTTWMACCGAHGWRRLGAGTVDGWCAWSEELPPGEALVVLLEACGGGPTVSPTTAPDGGAATPSAPALPLTAASPSAGVTGRVRSMILVLTAEASAGAVDPDALDQLDGEEAP